MHIKNTMAGILAFFLLISCATVGSRIKKDQPYFDSLGTSAQEQIKHGSIQTGFTPHMAFLAWGNPTYKVNKIQKKKTLEVWLYQYEGVDYHDEFVSPLSYGHRFHHVHHVGQWVAIPYHYVKFSRYVIFENNKAVESGTPTRIFYGRDASFYSRPWNNRPVDLCAEFSIQSEFGCRAIERHLIPALERLEAW